MYYNSNPEYLRAYCRSCLESLEIWARRLVNEKMVENYGADYMNHQTSEGAYLVKKEIRKHVSKMKEENPSRFSRDVDTLFIDQIIYFLCNHTWYNELFRDALKHIYPLGHDEVREYLERLVPIRNALSHSNPISVRQAEQAICYSHDFVDGLKEYYKLQGKEKMWNVPRIIKITDSFGNVFENPYDKRYGGSDFTIPQQVRPGDIYSIQIEIDPSFNREDYQISWKAGIYPRNKTCKNELFSISFDEYDVSMAYHIECQIVSNKTWHKYGTYDGEISVFITVLPPVE